MAVRRPLLPSRQLFVLLVSITLGLAVALVWLGWRLVRQDRELESQRVREHLERAAGTVAAALERRLGGLTAALDQIAVRPAGERPASLARWGDSLAEGALLVELRPGLLGVHPAGRLLFDPAWAPARDPGDPVFAAGERLEHRERDFAGAARAYEALTRSGDPLTRAGALLRLARTLRKGGRLEQALLTYDRLERRDSVMPDGLPGALAARHARIELLQRLGRGAAADAEARALYADLLAGTWRLSPGSFEFYAAELRARLGGAADSVTGAGAAAQALALSRAVDSLWREQRGAPADGSGRRLLSQDGASLLQVWSARAGTRVAFLATPEHLAGAWLPELAPVLERERVWLALSDPVGVGGLVRLPEGIEPAVVRPADAAAPWTIALAGRDPSALAGDLAARRRILLAGLVVASLLGLLGSYAVVRAVSRELEVARVQADFVSAVSHEFRTPLTSLRQLSELLASDRVPGEERRQAYYALMRRESLRLHRLVEGLLDFGRMEAGAHEFRFEPVEAGELVRGVVREFQEEAAAAERRIELGVAAEPCSVRGDREALGRALWNLLDNATKYSADGRPVRVSVTRANGRVAISVRDEGPGIRREEQGRVFEKFIRGSAAVASGVRGTGLGLAMVRQIARAHRGEIALTSVPGQGSTFTLTLPVAESDA